jgi:S1-C subfamily serine protease
MGRANAESQEVLQADNKQLFIWSEECLTEASTSTDTAYQKKVLTWADNHLKQVEKRIGANTQLGQAIADVETTLADVKEQGDPDKTKQDISQALQDVRPLIAEAAAASMPSPPAPQPASVEHAVSIVHLTEAQASAVVLVKGDNAEGTGFLVKTRDGPVIVTNIHVISNNPNLKITTNTGSPITILSYRGADDRDLAMIGIKDGAYNYLDLASDVSGIVQPGDEVITPGNSEGGEVMLNTDGKVLGIGPQRIEFDNPVYHGNSGGPVFHVKSGKVIGVVTEAVKVDVSDELDKASFANRNSAIGRSMRYFGLRIDTIPNLEPLDWRRFQNETAFLDQFDKRSRCLDCYLNAPNDDKPEDTLWRDDRDIVKTNDEFFELANGADTSQQMNADRVMWAEFNDIAASDLAAIQDPNNFYSYDRLRAADEAAYRTALKAELREINTNVSRLGALPRTNN